MADITTAEIAQFLRGMRAKFAEVQDQNAEQARKYDIASLYDQKTDIRPLVIKLLLTGTQKSEFTFVSGALGYFEKRNELEPPKETYYLGGYITSVQPIQWGSRIRVSREAVERRSPEYAQKLDEASKINVLASMTLSRHTWDFFNNLRTAPASLPDHLFAYNDGVRTASVAHPLKGGGTVSNCLANSPALSPDALDAALVLGFNTKADNGKPMPYFMGRKYLVVGPSLARKAKEIAITENTPYTTNFVANIFRGIYDVVVSPFITSTTQWTLVDQDFTPIRQLIYKDITIEDWYDNNVKAYVYDATAEWKIGNIDFRGIVHSVGDGSTITN